MKKIRNGSQVFWHNSKNESGIVTWSTELQREYSPIEVGENNLFWKDLPSVTFKATYFDHNDGNFLCFVCKKECVVRIR